MSNSNITLKDKQHQVLNLIDNDLIKESEILKELIESVISTNNRVKNIYQSELDKNYTRLDQVSSEQKKSQKGMLESESRKKKKLTESYITTQTEIFELNSMYRFKLFSLDHSKENTNYLVNLVDDISKGNAKILTNFFDQFQNAQNTYLKLKTIFIDKNINMQEQTYDKLVANMDANKLAFSMNIQSFKDKLESKVKEFTESISFDHLFNIFLEKNKELENPLNDLILDYENEKKEYVNKKNKLISSMKNELEELTSNYRLSLINKYDSIIQQQKESFIDLNSQIKKIDIDIKYNQSQNELYDSLIAQKVKLQHTLSKTIEEKVRHKVEKYLVSKEKGLLRKYTKINQVNLNVLRQAEYKFIKKVSQIERLLIDNMIEYNDKKVKTVHKITSFMQESYLELYKITTEFKRYISKICELLTIQNAYIKNQHLALNNSQKNLEIAVNKKHEDVFMLNKDMNKLIEIHYKKQQSILEYYLDLYTNYKLKINDIDFKTIKNDKNLTTSKIEKLRLIEKLKSSIIDNEMLIENAKKEYDIDYSKAKHLFSHEDSLNYVQEERINASVDVTKSMLKAMIQRQVNFADQQIKFAEEEYINRIEHIDVLNRQDISYINQRITEIEDSYKRVINTLEKDCAYRIDILDKRKLFFNKKKDIQQLEEEIESEKNKLSREIEKINDELNKNDLYVKYKNQLSQIISQVNNSKLDAQNLKEKNISLFNQLKSESYDRLLSFEQTVNIPTQLPMYDIETTKTAKTTLELALEIADKTLDSKLEKPSAELIKLKQQINELDLYTYNQSNLKEASKNEIESSDIQIGLEKILAEFETEQNQVKNMIESRYHKIDKLSSFEIDYKLVNDKETKYELLNDVKRIRQDMIKFKKEDKMLIQFLNKIGKSINYTFDNLTLNKEVSKIYKSSKSQWNRFKSVQDNIWIKETLLR